VYSRCDELNCLAGTTKWIMRMPRVTTHKMCNVCGIANVSDLEHMTCRECAVPGTAEHRYHHQICVTTKVVCT
jgi:hypothetical protein